MLRRVEFAVAVITLIVMATVLGCLVFVIAGHIGKEPDPAVRKTLARLAWVSFALMSLVMLVLAWMVIRYASWRLRRKRTRPQPTPYFDAWVVAGQRLQVPPDAPETLADLGIGDDNHDEGDAQDGAGQDDDTRH